MVPLLGMECWTSLKLPVKKSSMMRPGIAFVFLVASLKPSKRATLMNLLFIISFKHPVWNHFGSLTVKEVQWNQYGTSLRPLSCIPEL